MSVSVPERASERGWVGSQRQEILGWCYAHRTAWKCVCVFGKRFRRNSARCWPWAVSSPLAEPGGTCHPRARGHREVPPHQGDVWNSTKTSNHKPASHWTSPTHLHGSQRTTWMETETLCSQRSCFLCQWAPPGITDEVPIPTVALGSFFLIVLPGPVRSTSGIPWGPGSQAEPSLYFNFITK